MLLVGCHVVASDEVINIYEAEGKTLQNFINEALERQGSIAQAEHHPHMLVEAERGDDGSLGDVFTVDRNLIGLTRSILEKMDGVKSSVVSTRPYVSFPLVDDVEC